MAGGHGGTRAGAGRKPGKVNATTAIVRAIDEAIFADQARRAYDQIIAARRAKKLPKSGDPPRPSKNNAIAAREWSNQLLANLALKGSERCAIQINDRIGGRIPYHVEHSGDEQKGPIRHVHEIEYVTDADLDSSASMETSPPARRATRVKTATRKARR